MADGPTTRERLRPGGAARRQPRATTSSRRPPGRSPSSGEARGDRVERIDGRAHDDRREQPAPVRQPGRARTADHGSDAVERILTQLARVLRRPPATVPFLLDSAWPTPDLRAHGFMLMGHPPLMVRPPDIPLPAAAARAAHRRGHDDADRRRLRAHAHRRLSGTDVAAVRSGAPLHAGARSRPRAGQHFVGYVDDRAGRGRIDVRRRPTACASTTSRHSPKPAVAATGSRSPRRRSPSISRSPPTLIASDLGRPIYERLGFVAMSTGHVLARHCAEPRSGSDPELRVAHDRDRLRRRRRR